MREYAAPAARAANVEMSTWDTPGKATQAERHEPAVAGKPRGSLFGLFRPRHEDLYGNPGANHAPGGEHRLATIFDVANRGVELPDATHTARRAFVQPNPRGPLQLAPTAQPARDQLWLEREAIEQAPPEGFQEVRGFAGSIEAPITFERPDTGLFIGQMPSPDDIQQGNIGDCYFLSMLMSLTQRDPAKIKSIMKPDGVGGATVTLWRRQEHKQNVLESVVPVLAPKHDYIPVDVHVSGELWADHGGGLRGLQLRSATAPVQSTWWAEVASDELGVHRCNVFEVARWAPLMEKAFARFAQDFGQYGGFRDGNAAQPGGNGYDVIDGGWPDRALTVIYGPEADRRGAALRDIHTAWSPAASTGVALLSANADIVDQLCLLAGRVDGAEAPNVTASAMEHDMMTRLGPAVAAAIASPDFATVGATWRSAFEHVQSVWTMWSSQPAGNTKDQAYRAVGVACAYAASGGQPAGGEIVSALELTQRHAESSPIQAAMDLMLELRNRPDGSSQRNILLDHSYAVVGAVFVDATGHGLPLGTMPQAQRAALFPQVDTRQSIVRVRNPHHGNEPDRRGDNQPARPSDGAPSGAASDGVFALSLEQFLRNFSIVHSGAFKKAR